MGDRGGVLTVDQKYRVSWISQRLDMLGYKESTWEEGGSNSIIDFISGPGPKTLSVCSNNKRVAVICDETGQEVRMKNLCAYFLRPSAGALSRDNISKEIQFGSVGGKGLSMNTLKRIMEGFVEKQVAHHPELSGHFHKCMANLTDTVHHSDGTTVLYCPTFDYQNIPEAAQDKERLQIMESVVIHWTRQIKEVVNNHDSSTSAETAGPLDEIEFWKGRAHDFVGIQRQLEGDGVCRIIEVLNYAKSSYIGPFQTLTQQIVARAAEANDNLKYLETIRDQCTALRTIAAEKVVQILPDLMNRIRLIWSFSAFYNDNDRVCGILRKISNEIIRRFRSHVPVSEILDGDVEYAMSKLHDAIDCGVVWKAIFHKTVESIQRQKAKYGRVWEIDDASVFAQIDAFVQRCRDLIEVCENQMQFVRKSAATKGTSGPVPQFGGTKAQEIVSGIRGIQVSFEQHVDRLRSLDYDMLDVRVSKWHDDYHHFKNAVKDLEVMFTNVINAALEGNATVLEGVILIETFNRLAKREAIKRCVDKKASDIQHMFMKLVLWARGEFDQSRLNPPLRAHEPQYAGSALWAHSLAVLVTESHESLVRLKHILTTRDYEEAKEANSALISVIKDFKQARYNQWVDDLQEKGKENGLLLRLDKPLLRRTDSEGTSKSGTEIVCNFDEDLLALFSEVSYWEKFQGEFQIPYVAHDLSNKKEQLRVARERVMMVVRAYNDIIRDIGTDERHLFIDHLRRLDRRIGPGMAKLTWLSKNVVEMFVKDCCASSQETHSVVREFKESKVTIAKISKQIGTSLLLRIDKNQIYEGGVFESRQKDHRTMVSHQFATSFQTVLTILKNMYKHFRDGSAEVQREWKSQINQIDKLFEGTLKGTVKKSLQDLSRAINGDLRTEPQSLFTVRILLENNNRVTYMPSMVNLTHSVNIVAKDIISVVASFPRLRNQNFDTTEFTKGGSFANGKTLSSLDAHSSSNGGSNPGAISGGMNKARLAAVEIANTNQDGSESTDGTPQGGSEGFLAPVKVHTKSYYEIISEDTDILRIVVLVMNGMSSTATELQKYLSYWEKYKGLWEMDKDVYMRKQAKANKNSAQFESEITRFRSQQSDIYSETSTHVINFVRVDCNVLKDALVGHCLQCQTKLTGLLNQNGAQELEDIFTLFRKSKAALQSVPTNLDELSAKIGQCKELKEQVSSTQSRFEPVREIYNTLSKFEVAVKEGELNKLQSLETAYDDYTTMLYDAEKMLDKSKVIMKKELETQLDGYNLQMTEMRVASQIELPFSQERNAEEAMTVISLYRNKIIKAKEREVSLATGLSIFGIASSEHKELTAVTKDVDLLHQIWSITIEWKQHWDSWKTGQFNDLNVEEMEVIAGGYYKKVGKLGRDIKRWKVWEAMKTELDRFRETVPLIQDLRNPALRSRHWAALQERVGMEFDQKSASFTLNKVVKLGLNAHAEFIGELSANANKELAIEIALNDLEKRWADVELDVGAYKDRYYKLKSSDDISHFLEDDSVALSTMKASKFYSSFQTRIDEWEKCLSMISEVIDSILSVQRKWIYLESIFMSGGDIAKQLPQEHYLFVSVNTEFFKVMEKFSNEPNARRSCMTKGLLSLISKMDDGLERIQKSLNQYLETKRNVFPRFYFVSDDDLLEILGQSKDPMAVQKHMKKCFEGIKSLKMTPPGISQRTYEASVMYSPDGESALFADPVVIDGAVELWLVQVEKGMRRAISKLLNLSIQSYKGKKEKWVKDTIGQLLITTGSIMWTTDCSRALLAIAGGAKAALRQQKKKQVSHLNKLTGIIRGQLSKVDRNKVVSLITMEIHNRDVMEKMVKANCNSVSDFEWLSQLRFVFLKDSAEFGKCEVRQTNSVLEYSYEYQGNNGRLVVTPLTDRCVLTLITAMYLNRGGNPLGPAGTGKTETVKDLGKNLAKYVVVINCSDGMDYKSVGRIFSGLVQSGSWGCFDEFNRIKIEVISVVAMQVLSILNALSAKVPGFLFMGQYISCNPNCGIFITMNPGYAGRTELPDNLKALMRPVAMMAPDLTMIAEVTLASEGFNEARILAKKTITLYSLMIQQLSKQDHYDYGLRNLKAVLNMAGQLKRNDPTMSEEVILMRALRDMNLPKFIQDDERLFRLLLGDLFPSLELPISEYGTLQTAIEGELIKNNLQKQDFLIQKIFQLYDSRLTRHCNMLVGDPLGGKSTAWKMLAAAQTTLCKNGVEGFQSAVIYIISPKSINLDELYGAYDLATFEWKDGVLSTIFKSCSEDEKPAEKWVMFDGPIDAMWIESMNSVMDDNKILTLINGDRIPLTNSMSLLFETQDLRVASPATVSRAGMIYIDASELGWQTYTESWLQSKFSSDDESKELYKNLFDKWVNRALKFKELNCVEPVQVSDFSAVMSLCSLLDAILKTEVGLRKELLGTDYSSCLEKIFVFAMTWSIGASVDENGRKKFSVHLQDIDAIAPVANTLYDYYVDVSKNDFKGWDEKVPNWKPLKSMTFHDMIVPTVDTVRNSYIVEILLRIKKNVMIVGATGTGKTILANNLLKDLPSTHSQLVINFSATTTSTSVQDIIEGPMEKRSKDKLGPLGGKNLVIFIDDFNMPKLTSFDSPFQPPLELIRLWIDYQGWYDRVRCTWKYVLDSQLLVSMGHPGGGRNHICGRTQSRFSLINVTFPSSPQIVRIFEAILSSKFNDYDQETKQLAPGIAIATLNVYKTLSNDFLVTPEKFHYLFNIRDVAKVIQGILMATRLTVYSPEAMVRLWIHECQRVFADRFVRTKSNDDQKFRDILAAKMTECMQKDWGSIMSDAIDPKVGPLFCGLLTELNDDNEVTYEEVNDYKKVRTIVEDRLEDYNLEPKLIPMDLAMFRDAIMHVCKIHRVLVQPRGNLMLCGVGGSGRSSLTKLAAYIAGMSTFTIEITKNYRIIEFREDIKKLYIAAGCDNKKVVFLFNDTQIKDEGFLEDINNILSSGVVPNLFPKDEIPSIIDSVRKSALSAGLDDTNDIMYNFFIDRVRSNLHVVLAMSPIGSSLRNRCRMYPGLVNCTTINWFHTWPAEALQEVAMKFLAQVAFNDESYRMKISTVFAEMHVSVINSSSRMLLELKRYNYVTPTNYLELVKGYRNLLKEKSGELGASANKLANGLAKLEDAREQVETLSVELEVKKVVVAQSQKDCEDLLVQIVSERRVADDQKKQVEADSERIGLEAAECKDISDDAEADLAIAMPALERAMEEVEKLDKGAISEVKAYTKPPAVVETVLQAVMILFAKPTDWASAKKVLSEANFLQQIKGYDKDHVSMATNNKIKKYIENPAFTPTAVKQVSGAAAALCTWVHAIYIYANVAKEVAPKRQRLKEASEGLAIKQSALREAQESLSIVIAKLAALQVSYDTSVNEKNQLRQEAENLESKLDRADKLVRGLAGEYTRWQLTICEYNSALVKVTGDALIAAAFLSYAGPFETSYRVTLLKQWATSVNIQKLPVTDNFNFSKFLSKATDVRDWNIQGLPRDDFSTENGVISVRGSRWPLMIDPQGQANRWIRNMEGSRLQVIDLKMSGFLREVENAIQYGSAILLQDILEEIDPALEPILSKSILKVGNREVIRIGDKELDYSPEFRLYITTKLSNPHYTPEISTKATVVNFAVKKDGLEAQLLGIVVQREEPNLERQKSELTIRVAAGKRQLVELENEILRLLSESTGSLLDDEGLVNTLQQSKITSEEVTLQLIVAEDTEKKIDSARLGYKSAAVRSSLAYFVLDDMSRVDPMYQFSLDAYVDLFNTSIENSRSTHTGADVLVSKRCDDINTYHTLAVYKYTCRGLFEAHKLLFSLQLCIKILESSGVINQEEFSFFSLGAGMVDRSQQRPNNTDWLPMTAWDNITEMDKLSGFQGIVSSFEQLQREWKAWYMSGKPESETMPADWSIKTSELQKLCILRALRIDRVLFGAARFITANIGSEYVDPPPFDLKAVFETSNCKTPLIFVLSPGVDPTAGIYQLAALVNAKIVNCALGQGQAPTAVKLIQDGLKQGTWVFLANCHLMLSWMPTLEKMIESFVEGSSNPNFRLWLSSSPNPDFPISILQRGIKMTTEPPKGLRSNMLTLYNTIGDDQFNKCVHQSIYKKLLFSLIWFHAILLERRKFKSLGFNVIYDFNESDFAICHDLIVVFLDEYPDKVPFDAMKYLIAEANYGGRVTDDWDRRLVNVYIGELFCEESVQSEKFMLSGLPDYFVPEDGDLRFYKETIRSMPQTDHPLAFGQHSNSDMAASVDDANILIDVLVSLQPRIIKAVDEDAIDPLAAQCAELLDQTPAVFDMRVARDIMASRSDPDPLKTVLFQELDRYNKLLGSLQVALSTIIKVTSGSASITSELEEIMHSLGQQKVPRVWGTTYPSLKPLGSWMRDLSNRIQFFSSWLNDSLPMCWWLPAMTYPTGFLTAVLQVSARVNGVSIDSLSYETPVMTSHEKSSITSHPRDGIYASGIFIEGATWNYPSGVLEESRPMELLSAMPIIHFRPVEGKRKAAKGFYSCPLYMYPIRSGSRERPSYVVTVDLKGGKFSSDFWTKRGVAMLLSTSV